MGFRLGDIADHTDNGALRGIQREIACEQARAGITPVFHALYPL